MMRFTSYNIPKFIKADLIVQIWIWNFEIGTDEMIWIFHTMLL